MSGTYRQDKTCTSCGSDLYPIETDDNSGDPTYWIGCIKCEKFDSGTTKKIYDIARVMVDEKKFIVYHHDLMPDKEKDHEMFDYWRKSQISGTVRVVSDILSLNKESIIDKLYEISGYYKECQYTSLERDSAEYYRGKQSGITESIAHLKK